MDTKIHGITQAIVKQAITQAKAARIKILDKIKEIIPSVKPDLSENAPRIESLQIPVESIGKVIGTSGKTIKQLSADFQVEIFIEDDGRVSISGVGKDSLLKARKAIEGITSDPKPGTVYEGKVSRTLDFGVIVEIFPGKDGLLHVSRLANDVQINSIKVGQTIKVLLISTDTTGRLNFSMNLDDKVETSPVNNRGGGGGGFKKPFRR
jgi:polyribonucleotide nucleotidyltransferase